MGVRLPPEYQEVEYLEGQGAQWIQTNVRQRSGLRAKYRILFTSHISDTQQVFATNANQEKSLYFPYISSGKWYYGYDGAINTRISVASNTIYEVESLLGVGNQIINIDGNTIASGSNTTNISSTNRMGMFANANQAVPRYAYARIYYFDVFDTVSDTQISEFVPCYRKSDSKPGMYDLVSGGFFTNAGTGEFLVGADVIDSISPWLVTRRRGLMIPKVYGPNLVSLSDFTRRTEGGTCVIDDQTGIITVSGSNKYAGISTPYGFVGSHLIVGHTYEMHCRLVSATNASLASFSIRGKRDNQDKIAYNAIPTAVGAEASVVFTADEYMSYFTLFATWADAGSQTIAYSDVWVKEILR